MRRFVLGTAGHIDHGKTALVRALTGTDTDRLPDEKRRGITIDLGFAQLVMPDGSTVSIVDVPGHEAFVRNMLAGATGIDAVMLVVAADEGAMPQTREHLAILELLGVRRGIVVLTKTDLVEPEWLELVSQELREMLAATSLRDAPIVEVSARTGSGLDSLRAALSQALADVSPRSDADLFRMPIDRVFTIRGTGTVVTGTVWSGVLRGDASVHMLPAGFNARIRGLQQHGIECAEVGAGTRAAIALTGVDRDSLTRGDTLLTGAGWAAASILTVELHALRDATSPIRPRQRVRVHIGTAEVLGRVALLPGELTAGRSAVVQLRLESPIVARAGDHFVIRSYSPVHTIGGGVVLEPHAPKRKRLPADVLESLMGLAGPPIERVEASVLLAGASGLDPALLPIVTGLPPAEALAAVAASPRLTRAGERIAWADSVRVGEEAVLERVAAFHREQPILDGIEREAARRDLGSPALFDPVVTGLLETGRLVTHGNMLAHPDHAAAPAADAPAATDRLVDIYRSAGLEPPDHDELPGDLRDRPDLPLLIRQLESSGELIRLSASRLIRAQAVSQAATDVRAQLAEGQPLDIAQFKDVLKLTRKHLIPLLEYFDRSGVTRREGAVRFLR